MDLKEFVSETSQQIAEGVSDAQDSVISQGYRVEICPKTSAGGAGYTRDVEFSVAVVVDESSKSTVGGKAGLKVLEGSGSKEKMSNAKSENIIKFSIPVKLKPKPPRGKKVGIQVT